MAVKSYLVHDGKITSLEIPAADYIVENPHLFGFTDTEFHKIYEKYGEAFGTEGRAIIDILIKVTTKGWLIVEKGDSQDSWSFVFDSMDKEKDNLIRFLTEGIPNETINLEAGIRVVGLVDGFSYALETSGIASFSAFMMSGGKMIGDVDENGIPRLYKAVKGEQE